MLQAGEKEKHFFPLPPDASYFAAILAQQGTDLERSFSVSKERFLRCGRYQRLHPGRFLTRWYAPHQAKKLFDFLDNLDAATKIIWRPAVEHYDSSANCVAGDRLLLNAIVFSSEVVTLRVKENASIRRPWVVHRFKETMNDL